MTEFEPQNPDSPWLGHSAGQAALYEPDNPFIEYKALQLLYDFHALRYPNTHPSWIDVEQTDRGVVERSWIESPELAMNKSYPITRKAVMIKNLFIPVMKTLVKVNSEDPTGYLVAYCQAQLHSEYDTVLATADGTISVTAILPQPEVLRKMHEDLIVRRLSRSSALENFIADPTG